MISMVDCCILFLFLHTQSKLSLHGLPVLPLSTCPKQLTLAPAPLPLSLSLHAQLSFLLLSVFLHSCLKLSLPLCSGPMGLIDKSPVGLRPIIRPVGLGLWLLFSKNPTFGLEPGPDPPLLVDTKN